MPQMSFPYEFYSRRGKSHNSRVSNKKRKMHSKYLVEICSWGTVGNDANLVKPMFKIKYVTEKHGYFVLNAEVIK